MRGSSREARERRREEGRKEKEKKRDRASSCRTRREARRACEITYFECESRSFERAMAGRERKRERRRKRERKRARERMRDMKGSSFYTL